MLADITGRTIETISSPQNVGAVGAAAVASAGLGIIPSLDSVKDLIPVTETYYPNAPNHIKYNSYYKIFKKLYASNKKLYKELSK